MVAGCPVPQRSTGGAPVPRPDALAKARVAYQDFLGPWKDTDPDIPILKHAKPITSGCNRLLCSV
jgi:hypothetical protein